MSPREPSCARRSDSTDGEAETGTTGTEIDVSVETNIETETDAEAEKAQVQQNELMTPSTYGRIERDAKENEAESSCEVEVEP